MLTKDALESMVAGPVHEEYRRLGTKILAAGFQGVISNEHFKMATHFGPGGERMALCGTVSHAR